MATELQKKALEKAVEYGGKRKRIIKSKILLEIGASPATAKTPSKVFDSKGFLELAADLGLTDTFLTEALVSDIKKKPGKRTRELELGFKVRGKLKENGEAQKNTINFNFFGDEQARRIAARVLAGSEPSEKEPDGLSDSNEPEVRSELAS